MAIPKKMNWWYEAVIDWLLLNPDKTLQECAQHFAVRPAWLTQVRHSDLFQQRYEERRAQLSTMIGEKIIEKTSKVVDAGLDILATELNKPKESRKVSNDFVLEATDRFMGRLGMGVKGGANVTINNQPTVVQTGASREAIESARQQIRQDQIGRIRQTAEDVAGVSVLRTNGPVEPELEEEEVSEQMDLFEEEVDNFQSPFPDMEGPGSPPMDVDLFAEFDADIDRLAHES